ncbi:MAG: hypothetical protein Q7R76_03350 [Candidatus Woesearchaeota archaeon]|nr:hypothetical protein [Candidatus Woesearchaeota archaeon]
MVKRLNLYGKILHVFTAFFPIYVYWAYFLSKRITSWSIKDIIQPEYIIFLILCMFSIISVYLFYQVILKKSKNQDKEINIRSTEMKSSHVRYIISSLSPFILFLAEFIKDNTISKTSVVVGSIIFIVIGLVLILKEENGILYNLFYIPYYILNVKTKDGKELIIISKKQYLTGYIKVSQLDGKVFKEWN